MEQLLADRGFADVYAVVNSAARLSSALRGPDDPGVVTSTQATQPGAPYSKPMAGKVRVRCAKWDQGCEVREVERFEGLRGKNLPSWKLTVGHPSSLLSRDAKRQISGCM